MEKSEHNGRVGTSSNIPHSERVVQSVLWPPARAPHALTRQKDQTAGPGRTLAPSMFSSTSRELRLALRSDDFPSPQHLPICFHMGISPPQKPYISYIFSTSASQRTQTNTVFLFASPGFPSDLQLSLAIGPSSLTSGFSIQRP